MRPESEYQIVIKRIIPKRGLPGTEDQQWEFLMAVFRDVLEMYPSAGVTVTRCRCPVVNGRLMCGSSCQPMLSVSGTDQETVERLLQKSEQAHRYWK